MAITSTLMGREDLRFWEIMAFGAYFIGLIAMAIFAASTKTFALVFGVLVLVGTAAWLAGTALGFLFGVPRVRSAVPTDANVDSETSIIPNTNLEQISDWLTKIIVGATLVQLAPLTKGIGNLAEIIGEGLGVPSGAAASGGVIVFYFAAGFMWGYLWCSLRIFREIRALVQRERRVRTSEAALPSASRGDASRPEIHG